MNKGDIPRVVRNVHAAAAELDRLGPALYEATHDWQSPLRSGGAKGPKGDHADPTPQTAMDPDPLALEHADLVADIARLDEAAASLTARLRRLAPIDPNKVERGRVNTVPACMVCAGPAPRCRRGMCDSCYTAWLRADRPDIYAFRKERTAVPEREHVDPRSDLGMLA